jgi:hypothetical protein
VAGVGVHGAAWRWRLRTTAMVRVGVWGGGRRRQRARVGLLSGGKDNAGIAAMAMTRLIPLEVASSLG